jgi:hypothetical protein
MKFMLTIFCSLIFLAMVQSAILADEPQLSATLDKNTARVNEEMHLNIRVIGVRGGVQAPTLPSLEGFEIFYSGRSSRFSFVNGQSQSLTEFNYVLIPRNAGRFIIQPIEVELSGRTYRTKQLEVEILGAQALRQQSTQPKQQTPTYQPPQQTLPQASGPAGPNARGAQSTTLRTQSPTTTTSQGTLQGRTDIEDPNIFLRVIPDKINAFTNEQIILTYAIYTRYDTRYEGFEEEPETSGFWIEEFPMDYKNLGRSTERVNGRKYVRADIKKIALFPTAPGEYVLKPGQVKASVQIQEGGNSVFDDFFSDSFFGGSGLFARRAEKYLTALPLTINVRAVPERGKPASFKGAVGDFRMTSEVDKRVINQNEAVTLKITIEGQGNIETLASPSISEPPNTKMYESDVRSQLFRQQNVIAGNKTFEIIFIPTEAGDLIVPGVAFSFFNPRSDRYVTVRSEAYQIQVNPSKLPTPTIPKGVLGDGSDDAKKTIERESEDIYYIKERMRVRFRPETVVPWVLGVNGILTLALLGFVVSLQRSAYLDENIHLKRTLSAKKFARKGIKQLEQLAKRTGDKPEAVIQFFDQCARVLNQYLSDKLNLSEHGMTRDVIEQELMGRGVNAAAVGKIAHCYDACDEVRFGKRGRAPEERREMIKSIREITEEMEKS